MYCRNCGNEVRDGSKFCTKCGASTLDFVHKTKSSWLRRHKILAISLGTISVLILLLVVVAYSGDSTDSDTQDSNYSLIDALKDARSERNVNTFANKNIKPLSEQDKIAASVVDILCEDGDNSSGGSGTIIDPDGLVLTNNHIIPVDKDGNPTVSDCVVTLPDPQTGKIDEIYIAQPIQIPYLSKKYDLAFLSISAPYVDDEGNSYGTYPKTFESFWSNGCSNDEVHLGESVKVYGYPAISAGGLYLTITDGLVSAIPNDGTIVTSAKVDHGSSGGLAIDENGCMIGVPSMISGDENESFGVIISNPVIEEFMKKVQSILDNE